MRSPTAWSVPLLLGATLALLMTGGMGLELVHPYFAGSAEGERGFVLAGFAVMEAVAVVAPTWAFLALGRLKFREVAPFTAVPAWRLGAIALGTLGLGLVITYLQSGFTDLTHLEYPQEIAEMIRARGPLDALLLFGAVALVPAAAEEVFTRGYVQSALVPKFGLVGGIAVTSALFALLHWTPAGVPTYLVLGVWLSLIRWRTGSLVGCVLAHTLNNTLAILQENFVPEPFWAANMLWVLPLGLALTALGGWGALGREHSRIS